MNLLTGTAASVRKEWGACEKAGEFHFDAGHVLEWGALGPRYAGYREGTPQEVSITIVRPELSRDPDFVERFRDELALQDRLSHPNILGTLGRGMHGGRLFYATERVPARRLDEYARTGQRFSTDELLQVGETLCRVLMVAQRAGVSPAEPRTSTVYVASDGTVKASDLFVGRLMKGRGGLEALVGTWSGLSPEAARGLLTDVRSDVYALGVLLYELATGRPPFEGHESRTSLAFQVLHMPPCPPREAGAAICRDLERVILQCLAKDPQDRPATPSALLEELEALRVRKAPASGTPTAPEDDGGDFEIFEESVVAQGGMGILFKGRQKSLDRPVVVKVIRDLHLGNAEYRERFRAEAELLAQVKDGHVVQVFGAGTWKGRPFYAMELVDGEDLGARLAGGWKPGVADILHVAHGVGSALRAVWKFRIVHRDIKPANILWARDGTIKLTDFGLAKSLRIRRHESRFIMGTPCYLSPEQGTGDEVDVRSDLYSLGVVLYELTAGRTPYPESGESGELYHQRTPAPLPPIEAQKAPAALLRVIYRCLARNPADRYQAPEDFLRDVEGLRDADLRDTTADALERFEKAHVLRSEAGESLADFRAAMGLGDYAAALDVAASVFGTRSPEYAAAKRRAELADSYRLQDRALECFREKRWAEALELYRSLFDKVEPSRHPEVREAISRCAKFLEEKSTPGAGLSG